MHRLKCAEIWGGIENRDSDVCSSDMTVSLYSSSCAGGKGGDVYYSSVCSFDRVTCLVLADVVGHGEPVSRISQWVYDQLVMRLDNPDLPGLVSELNRGVMGKGIGGMTTAVIMSYYRNLEHLYYCYAGHPPMLACRGNSGWNEVLLSHRRGLTNLPLGVSKRARYDIGDVALARGDGLLIFSDGVVEACDSRGEHFGTDRLRAALAGMRGTSPMEVKSIILKRLREWTGGPFDHDDVTLLAIRPN